MDKKVLSLGAIAMDVVLNSYELPKDDGFALIHHEEMLPGGSASNVSVACASLGMEAYQTGKIGDDEVGSQFRKTLVADHVDDRYVVTKENGTTLHTYIITAPGGKHCIFANAGDAWIFSTMICSRRKQPSGWQRKHWSRASLSFTICSVCQVSWRLVGQAVKRLRR